MTATMGEILKAAIAKREAGARESVVRKPSGKDDSAVLAEAMSVPAGPERARRILEIAARQAPRRA